MTYGFQGLEMGKFRFKILMLDLQRLLILLMMRTTPGKRI
ncbi:hypothetical protein Gotri_024397 [Gossypium trilobum]|uniref:Uncharacterized protein n=1 Tax=Gossypium trilobum TaxID=34281 RepID=A0A7J9DM40_9ROSI|nr:hypothetical protein [Gossypium trilobum]